MGQSSQTPSRAGIKRRQAQSRRDREQHEERERREFWGMRRRQRTQQARASHQVAGSFPLSPVVSRIILPETMLPALSCKSLSDTGRAFDSLFNTHKYTDVTIYLGASKVQFPAHRAVLGIRSPYFDDAFQSKFKEGITQEFRFEEDSPHALWRVLQYIYTGDYSDEPSDSLDSEGDDLELLRHPRVYALADMFRMDDLKSLSCEKFELQLQTHWISDTFADCIREVYLSSMDTDPIEIRKTVVDVVSSHRELVQKPAFQELIREVGDFAVDLVLQIAKSEKIKEKSVWGA